MMTMIQLLIAKSDCDSKLKTATKICLSLEPEKRYSDATELKQFVNKSDKIVFAHNFSLVFFKELLNDKVIPSFCIVI